MRIRFGDVTFDPEAKLLLRGPRMVHLEPKAFRLLELLVAKRPNALSKAELIEAIWPDTFVQESNLTSLVRDVRSAIGDEARSPVFVRTVHGFGYAFGAETVEAPQLRAAEGFRHWLTWGENMLRLSQGENFVGRDPDAHVWLGDVSVSRRHVRIVVQQKSAILEDLGSKNGTRVGGLRIQEPVRLRNGDEVVIGSVALVFHVESEDATATSV